MATLELSDDWRTEEPLAYLVKNFNTTMFEYMVFAKESEAINHAEDQEQAASDAGEAEDWIVYPLFAGWPKD